MKTDKQIKSNPNPSESPSDFHFRSFYGNSEIFTKAAVALKAKGVNVWFRNLKNDGIEVAIHTSQIRMLPTDKFGAFFGADRDSDGFSLHPSTSEVIWDVNAAGEWGVY